MLDPLRRAFGVGPSVILLLALQAIPASAEVVLPSETCRGLFFVPVTFGEGQGTTLDLLLDTGASRTYLDSGALRRVLGRDVGIGKATLENARIGPFEIGTLRAYILRLNTLSLALGRKVDGIIGYPAFREVLLTFDQKEKRIRMQTHGTDPIRMASWVGLGVGFCPRARGLEIIKVFAGTSAEAAGLRAGDLIVTIDGTPVHERGCGNPGATRPVDAGCCPTSAMESRPTRKSKPRS